MNYDTTQAHLSHAWYVDRALGWEISDINFTAHLPRRATRITEVPLVVDVLPQPSCNTPTF